MNFLTDTQQTQNSSADTSSERSSRFVIFPLQDHASWELYKQQLHNFWLATGIDMTEDVYHWNKYLNENEKHYLKHVLAFFAASDGIVAKNVNDNFVKDVESRGWIEALFCYQFQIMMENVHNESYSLMIETLINDADERNYLFNALENVPSVKKKADWAMKWMGEEVIELPKFILEDLEKNKDSLSADTKSYLQKKSLSFAERLIAFIAVEGIFFSGSFCAIYWLKAGITHPGINLMPGLCKFNEYISRDEGIHQTFGSEMYKQEIKRDPSQKLSQDHVHTIIKEAVEIEQEFVTKALPVRLIGMNDVLMKQYIEYIADRILVELDYDKLYGSEQPFDWMELISMNNKTNFFEERVTDYSKGGGATTNANEDGSKDMFNFDHHF